MEFFKLTDEEEVLIEVKNLSKIFGDEPDKAISLINEGYSKNEIHEKTGQTVGLYNINFEVKKGEIFVLMGLSGSGKSTLLRCINRLIPPTHGEIYIEGEDITKMDMETLRKIRREKLSMVFQNFALLPHRTVLDNVAYGLEVYGVDKEERHKAASEAIETVGLSGYEGSRITQLSGGMQQRVGLARALATDPHFLLMDEAFSALDPLIRSEMQDELLSLQEQVHKTIIFVTHDLDEALKIGDRIALMKDGMIVQVGTAEEILTEPANQYVSQFIAGVDKSKVLTAESIMMPPEPVISIKSGPSVALQLMREHGISSIFVVDRNRKLEGIVTVEDAAEARRNKKNLEDVIIREYPTTTKGTQLKEIIPMIADSSYPVAVVDDSNRLLGVLVRGGILGAIAMEEEEQ